MALNLTEAAGLLKEVYLPMVREQLNNKHILLTQIEKNTEDVEGNEAILSLHVRRNSGVGARREGGSLPKPGNQKYTKERVPLRTQTGRIELTVQAIKAMRSNKSAFERAVESEMKRIVNDLKRDVNRQCAGTSDGTIATTAANTAVNVIALAAATTAVQLRQIEIGMLVDISTAASAGDAAKAAEREVTAVDFTNKTITVSGAAVTTAAGDRVERSGAGGSAANQQELTGLQTIVNDSGTLFNVDPATYPVWKAYKDVPGADRSPTESVFQKAMDEVETVSGEEINLWLTTHGVKRGFAANLTSLKRFANTVELKGGFKGLDITSGSRTAVLATDRDIPLKTAFGLNTDHLTQHEEVDWEWMDEDGAVLSRTPDKLGYEATIYKIHEVTTDKRNTHALVGALIES